MELVEEDKIARRYKDIFAENVLEIKIPRIRRIFIHIGMDVFKEAILHITKEDNFYHVSTITGVDLGEEIEVIYHLNRGGGIELSLKVRVPKDNPTLPTITHILPGATLYEREVHDLLGVNFKGHPDLSPLILPEGWPKEVYPLRKEWTVEKIREKIMKEGES